MAKLLLSKGADIHLTDNSGMTALAIAMQRSDQRMAVLLIEKGANLFEHDNVSRNSTCECDPQFCHIFYFFLERKSSGCRCSYGWMAANHVGGYETCQIDPWNFATYRWNRHHDHR